MVTLVTHSRAGQYFVLLRFSHVRPVKKLDAEDSHEKLQGVKMSKNFSGNFRLWEV